MLKRKAYSSLLEWKMNHFKKCLMIKGTRQVGKTFLVREFGKNEYESFIEMNFIKNPNLKEIFSGDLDVETIAKRISFNIEGAKLVPGKTLIFMDEIQVCGRARTAIKFLAEDGRFDVITSGSLLGLTYAEDDDPLVEEAESNPTGYEDFLTMYSLDFEEFLWSLGVSDEQIAGLKTYFDNNVPVDEITNKKFENLFREFIAVGGMPEVVADYAVNRDFNRVHKIQSRIVSDYQFDIGKHAKGAEKVKVRKCYDSLPRQLSKEITKFQYSLVEKGQTRKKYGGSITWLIDSGLVNACYSVNEPFIPLFGNSNEEQFKLYGNDTGLLCSKYGFEMKKAVLDNFLKGNAKGGVYENVIGECLVKKGYKLYYYRPDDSHEIEFLIEKDGEVLPIEVKAGNSPTVSLNRYIEKYGPSIAYKLIDGNVGLSQGKKTIPHYMIMFI
ncbi:MAG: ATP-binding protein [Bacilli bacterium]|nr:ATP-binding protein [Bacilli bacterium]